SGAAPMALVQSDSRLPSGVVDKYSPVPTIRLVRSGSSQSGWRLCTAGMPRTLYGGDGVGMDHSSVSARQGLVPASAPRRADHSKLMMKTSTPTAVRYAPR